MSYLLQRSYKLLELGGSVVHEQQPGKGVIEHCPIACVLLEKGKVVTCVMVQHETDSFQLLH